MQLFFKHNPGSDLCDYMYWCKPPDITSCTVNYFPRIESYLSEVEENRQRGYLPDWDSIGSYDTLYMYKMPKWYKCDYIKQSDLNPCHANMTIPNYIELCNKKSDGFWIELAWCVVVIVSAIALPFFDKAKDSRTRGKQLL